MGRLSRDCRCVVAVETKRRYHGRRRKDGDRRPGGGPNISVDDGPCAAAGSHARGTFDREARGRTQRWANAGEEILYLYTALG
jgi:hypothetical protein